MTVRQWFGTYQATVYSNADPQNAGRLQLRIPQVLGTAVSQWAVPVEYGITTTKKPGTTVTAVFLGGDPSHPAYFHTMDPDLAINGTLYSGGLQIGGADGSGHTGYSIDSGGHEKVWDASAGYFIESLPEYAAMLFKNTNTGDFSIIAGVAGNDSYWGHNDSFGVGFTGKVTAWNPSTSYPNLTAETWHSVAPTPTGWLGSISYTLLSESAKLVMVDFALSMAQSTAITQGEQLATIPAAYAYPGDNKYVGIWLFPHLAAAFAAPINIASSGAVNWEGGAYTSPAGGLSYLYGQGIYTIAV